MNKLMLYIGTFLMQRTGNVFHHKDKTISSLMLKHYNIDQAHVRQMETESLAMEVLQSLLHGKGDQPLPRTIMLHIQETKTRDERRNETLWKIECYGEEVTTVQVLSMDHVGDDRHGYQQHFIITEPFELTPPTA